MIKDKSIKLIAMISKKIILEKRITKYQAIIEDINEYVQDNLNSTKNIKDFENIFNKLKSEYKSKLVDTSEEDEEDNENDKNENDNDNEKMEMVEK
jgi:anionic cell wall polymer biosynthesis LytR-Cps2A-Psr (LCP) family protein